MKKDSLETQRKDVLKQLKQLTIDSSRALWDTGIVPNNMLANEKKLQKKLLLIEEEIEKLEEAPVTKPVTKTDKKTNTKKVTTKKDEETEEM